MQQNERSGDWSLGPWGAHQLQTRIRGEHGFEPTRRLGDVVQVIFVDLGGADHRVETLGAAAGGRAVLEDANQRVEVTGLFRQAEQPSKEWVLALDFEYYQADYKVHLQIAGDHLVV